VRAGEANINAARIAEVDGTDTQSLTRAEIEGRGQIMTIFDFLHQYVPGFERSYVLTSAPFIGIRETRCVIGEYVLSGSDVLEGRKFGDAVLQAAYPVDIHGAKGKGTTFRQVGGDGAYDIPYRCLVPLDVDGFLIAGRCISAAHEAQGSLRVMVTAMATGQAAGAAAALSAQQATMPRNLDVRTLRQHLRAQGVSLSAPDIQGLG